MANTAIAELMAAPVDSRDIAWRQESLQAALELELSTLPVYLSGMWSIKNQSGEVHDLIDIGEIRYGHKFVEANGKWDYTGDPVPFPDCYPVVPVSPGGYPELPASEKFNTACSQLLAHLQDAWSGGGQDALAAPIIATPLPDGSGNYGPDFIPVPAVKS